jgi:hypothetical protein
MAEEPAAKPITKTKKPETPKKRKSEDKESQKKKKKLNHEDEEAKDKQNIFWNDFSLLSDILKDNYEKEGTLEFFKEAQNILKKQFLTNLSQWKKLTKEQKKLFPVGLTNLLDEVCGIENKVEWNDGKIFLNFILFIRSNESQLEKIY